MRLITALTQHDIAQINSDLERMIWWSTEPFYSSDPDEVLGVLVDLAKHRSDEPLLSLAQFVMRRMASAGAPADLIRCAKLLRVAQHPDWESSLVAGFEEAFKGRSMAGRPPALVDQLVTTAKPPLSLLLRLDTEAHLPTALAALQSAVTERNTKIQILDFLSESRIDDALPLIISLLETADEDLLPSLLASLQIHESPDVARAVLVELPLWSDRARDAAEGLLTSRLAWSKIWVHSWDADHAENVSINAVDQLRRFDDPTISAALDQWIGREETNTAEGFDAEVARVRSIISAPGGDPVKGHGLYQQRCATCHTLFDQGGLVGPDLTYYQRDDLDSLLLSIVHPSAEIRAGYEMSSIETTDGRLLSGFLSRNAEDLVGIRTVGGSETILQRAQITRLEMQDRSLMPEALLEGMADEELRDLFNYLRSPQPLSISN